MKYVVIALTAAAAWLVAKFTRFCLEPDYVRVKKGK